MKSAKRFYKDVSTAPFEEGFGVLLDGRQLKTPQKRPLLTTSEHVAQLVAAEWDAQVDDIRPELMPVTRLVNVSIELTPDNRDKLANEARNYGGTDLLCYRAADPAALTQRQDEQWGPVLEWAAAQGIKLETTRSVMAISQDDTALDKITQYAGGLDDLNLTLCVHLVAVFGSAILGMAVMERHLSGAQAFELSRLDNLYQIEQWGEDEEATENAARLEAEVIALCKIL